jgi:polar amino acid transport system substrate-binding protein
MHRAGLLFLACALALGGVSACGDGGSFATDDFSPVHPGRLTVVTNLPAPGFWRGDTPATVDGGFEYGIGRELARRFGLRLRVRQVPFTDLVAGRVRGYDLGLSQVSVTTDRAAVVDFSIPYFRSDAGILTRRATAIPDLESARTKTWVVQRGSVEADFVRDVVIPDRPVTYVDDIDAVVDTVRRGAAEAGLLDTVSALAAADRSAGRLHVPAQFALNQQLGAVLPKGSDNRIAVDQALRRLKANGTLDDLERRWIRPITGGRDPGDVPILVTKEAPR